MLKTVRKITKALAQPLLPFVVLPAMMALLTAGTVAQRYVGLYDAQKTFISSFVFWAGPLPLPGGYTLMAVLALGLLAKFLFYSPWSLARAGINLAHLGVLVLLAGGLLSAVQSREGSLVVAEGETARTVRDFHTRALAVFHEGAAVAVLARDGLKPGRKTVLDGGRSIEILSVCRNCAISRRGEDAPPELKGMARFMSLSSAPPALKDEENLYGLTFRLSGFSPAEDGVYITFDPMPKPVSAGGYTLEYGKAGRDLPFDVRLVDFRAENHPGTAMARAYSSQVEIVDGNVTWPALIEMNSPLRYKGYTLFQSSFMQEPGAAEITVLSVVENRAWLFPYIGTAVMAAGLLLHFVLAAGRRRA